MLPVSTELYGYWRALKADRSAPERNDVEPGAIRSILADTFMLDFDERAGFPLRIAGSKANALFMRELRGSPFLGLWREDQRESVRVALRRAADEREARLLIGEARPHGLDTLRIEALVLPLSHLGSTHARMLGSIAAETVPQWLGLIALGPIALHSAEPIAQRSPVEPAAGLSLPPPRRQPNAAAPYDRRKPAHGRFG